MSTYGDMRKRDRSPFFNVENPYTRARETMAQAAGTSSQMTKERKVEREPADPTIGGAITSGMSGAAAGGMIGSAASGAAKGSYGSWWGAGIGAVLGMVSYFLS